MRTLSRSRMVNRCAWMPCEASRCATPYGSSTSRVREYTTEARDVFCPSSWSSTTVTWRPRASSETVAVRPVGPAPTTSTSVVVGSMRKPPRVKDSGRSARIEATGSTGFDLADLDEVAVGIAHVAADLDAVVLWLGE